MLNIIAKVLPLQFWIAQKNSIVWNGEFKLISHVWFMLFNPKPGTRIFILKSDSEQCTDLLFTDSGIVLTNREVTFFLIRLFYFERHHVYYSVHVIFMHHGRVNQMIVCMTLVTHLKKCYKLTFFSYVERILKVNNTL